MGPLMKAIVFRSIWDYRRALAPRGAYLMAGGDWPQIRQALLWGPLLSLVGRRRLGPSSAKASQQDLGDLGDLLASGRVRPVIDRRYPLGAVPDAIRYVEAGHASGKVIINVDAESPCSSNVSTGGAPGDARRTATPTINRDAMTLVEHPARAAEAGERAGREQRVIDRGPRAAVLGDAVSAEHGEGLRRLLLHQRL